MDEGRPLAILDSRSAAAWAGGTAKAVGAIRVPPDDVEAHLEDIPRDRTIVAYCT
jgi:rhodanese-related sulfurtransferase